ncbi:hypothetical protein L914_06650 [Phytophthora nicotianae]|uniref:Uncharacterized protein n=2 Tax=Phytophthora nicotianae TaxID=4792 RepID=W2NMG7_PHYNI|nr:hypothetical protein L914_06650 [Phytophthora nicotianae]ETO77953.1 hypothetical protein F444_06928 [Phytophthora nicotianae P1976]
MTDFDALTISAIKLMETEPTKEFQCFETAKIE